jgi:hypothetical protein
LLKKIKENSRAISDKITDETLSDPHLYACILDLERLSKEYAFIQGKISSHETFLFQYDDEQRGEWE